MEGTLSGEFGQTVLFHVGEDDVFATENAPTPCRNMVEKTVRALDHRPRPKNVIQRDVQVDLPFVQSMKKMKWDEMIPTRLGLYQNQNNKRTLQNNFKNFLKFKSFKKKLRLKKKKTLSLLGWRADTFSRSIF